MLSRRRILSQRRTYYRKRGNDMLTIHIRNTFTDTQNNGHYVVSAMVNSHPIWNGQVAHHRPDGASTLLRKIADAMDEDMKVEAAAEVF